MWLSLHIYHGDDLYGRDIDRLLALAIAPLVNELLAQESFERYFFVRYGDPGSHVRLRFKVRARKANAIEERVHAAIFAFLKDEEGCGGLARKTRIERVPYTPEVERYGGRSGLQLAERHFLLSSMIALKILAETLDKQMSLRVGKALFLSVILVGSVFGGSRSVASFLDWYAESYLRHFLQRDSERHAFRGRLAAKAAEVEDAVDRALRTLLLAAERGDGVGVPILDAWASGCRRLLERIHRAADGSQTDLAKIDPMSFLASLLHMHHNRLGLSIPQEVQLAHLAASSLVRQEIITP